MFFDRVEEIPEIAKRCGTAIFVTPRDIEIRIKGALVLSPEDKSVITIEQVRQVMERLGVKQTTDMFVVIKPAELLNVEAANALLKSLEEPGEKVHFVLVTDAPSQLLPTILSRAAVYIMREAWTVNEIKADDKVKVMAKKLMAARGAELVTVAEEIVKKKDGVRVYTLSVLGVAIEMLYKTYFITGKEVFLNKIPKFLAAYEGVARNGHIKLQIVANLN